jgi:ABC-type cobalamin/Fe3+-siderophores transport system ATPase subunit
MYLQEGEVLLDGRSLRELNPSDLRRRISIVLQARECSVAGASFMMFFVMQHRF